MKRIALAMALTALAAPASAFSLDAQTANDDATANRYGAARQEVIGEFGPVSEVFGKLRNEAFRKRQAEDAGGSLDGDRRYRHQSEDRKRNVPRRRATNPGDLGGRVPDTGAAGDSAKK